MSKVNLFLVLVLIQTFLAGASIGFFIAARIALKSVREHNLALIRRLVYEERKGKPPDRY